MTNYEIDINEVEKIRNRVEESNRQLERDEIFKLELEKRGLTMSDIERLQIIVNGFNG